MIAWISTHAALIGGVAFVACAALLWASGILPWLLKTALEKGFGSFGG